MFLSSARFAVLLGLLLWGTDGFSQTSGAPSGVRVSYSASEKALAPLVVRFQATVPAGSQVNWNFGDGAAGSGETVSHTFYRPGRYATTVQIKNARGQLVTSGQQTIEVKSAGAEHAALTLLLAPGSLRLSEAGSLAYAPRATRYWLDGKEIPRSKIGSDIKSEVVSVAPGRHHATVRVPGSHGPLEKSLDFTTAPVQTSAPFDLEVFRLTNQARAQGWNCVTKKPGGAALPPFTRDATLDSAAQAQSVTLALSGVFAHESALDGSAPPACWP